MRALRSARSRADTMRRVLFTSSHDLGTAHQQAHDSLESSAGRLVEVFIVDKTMTPMSSAFRSRWRHGGWVQAEEAQHALEIARRAVLAWDFLIRNRVRKIDSIDNA